MSAQSEKAKAFAALHAGKAGFILPNPWDVGSARILAHHGFKALATTSVGYANTLGRADYQITLDEALAHSRDIAGATDLPVSADFENGFADKPEGVADNVLRAAETGLVGCSIEDATRDPKAPIYPFELAVERVHLAVLAARRTGMPFTITARAEGLLHGEKDIGEIIKRLQAFEKVGAPCVYATGVRSIEQARQIAQSVHIPVNVMAMPMFTASELFAAGVKRVSLGPWFGRAAMKGFLDAVEEVKGSGSFGFVAKVPTGAAISTMLKG